MYIGKADFRKRRQSVEALRWRLSEFGAFGAGDAVAHWGGRLIWQLADVDRLLSVVQGDAVNPGSGSAGTIASMSREFRALISVPITAEDEAEAMELAVQSAHSLTHPSGGNVVAGHLELLGEVRSDTLEIARVVDTDPAFLRQLPPDWRP